MQVSVDVLTTEQEIIDGIMAQFKDFVDTALSSSLFRIRELIYQRVQELIVNAPEMQALSGDLGQALGISSSQVDSIINDIVVTVQDSIEITYDKMSVIGGRIANGGYTIKVLRADFRDVLSIPDSSYTTKNGINIPWLNWLLFAGDSVLLYGYRLQIDPNNPSGSRTGAIMVKDKNGSWGIPTEYAGTQDDNFLTRALLPLQAEIGDIVERELGF